MEPLPKQLEYYVVTEQEERHEWINGVRVLVGYEDVSYVHRRVTKDDQGRKIVVSDTRESNDPDQWRKDHPNLRLIGETVNKQTAAEEFLKNATPEQLADLGLTVVGDAEPSFPEEVPEEVDVDEDFDPTAFTHQDPLGFDPDDVDLSEPPVDEAERERELLRQALNIEDDEE